MLLNEKIALVTGSTSNIGLKTAESFAREGATAIITSRHQNEAKAVARKLGGDYFVVDVAQPEQVDALFSHIRKKHGRLDILVNSVAHTSKNDILQTTLKEWNDILGVNLTGYFLCTQHAARIMKEHAGGVIINISAASGERGSPGSAAYSVSKGAINALTRQAAMDLAPFKIRVNGVISGIIGTPLGKRDMGSRKQENQTIPLGHIGRPEDVAEAVTFLASEKANYITNALLPVDGGRLNSFTRASGSR